MVDAVPPLNADLRLFFFSFSFFVLEQKKSPEAQICYSLVDYNNERHSYQAVDMIP